MADGLDSQLEGLKKEILDFTIEYWRKHEKALLLAYLGQELTRRGHNIKAEIRGQKLASFITAELKDIVTVVTSPFDRLVYGLVPTKEAEGKKLADLFVESSESVDSPKLNLAKWILIAFSRPIEANRVRIVRVEPDPNFEDVPADSVPAGTKLVLPADLIVPPGSTPGGSRNAELQKNIRTWFDRHGLDLSTVEVKRHSGYGVHASDSSVLSLLFRTLERKDLERIVIPLDIVAKLLSKGPKND